MKEEDEQSIINKLKSEIDYLDSSRINVFQSFIKNYKDEKIPDHLIPLSDPNFHLKYIYFKTLTDRQNYDVCVITKTIQCLSRNRVLMYCANTEKIDWLFLSRKICDNDVESFEIVSDFGPNQKPKNLVLKTRS